MLRLLAETILFAVNRTHVLLWTNVVLTGGIQFPIIAATLLLQPWVFCGVSAFSDELHKLHSAFDDVARVNASSGSGGGAGTCVVRYWLRPSLSSIFYALAVGNFVGTIVYTYVL